MISLSLSNVVATFSFISKIYYTGLDGVVVVYSYLNEKEKGRKKIK